MSYLKGSEYSLEDMVHNLRQFINCATDAQYNAGKEWYQTAADEADKLARLYQVSIELVVGVIAALSPNNQWAKNIQNAQVIIDNAVKGGCADDVMVSTYGLNKEKAHRIACGELPLDVLGGEKVRSFYTNILACYHGTLENEVTVDMWALRVVCGVFDARTVAISDRVYDLARQAYQVLADELGIAAKQLQAIAWVVIRELTAGIREKLTHNLTLFCPNCHILEHSYIVYE